MPRPHVVIIGSGFGGLFSARALAKADVDITIISKTTAHLFQPLLYQVATGILSSGEIAPATRDILAKQKNVKVLLGEVSRINVKSKIVVAEKLSKQIVLRYDYLIVAAGAGQSYFGNDHFATFAPGMKSIDDALELRARIFGALEMAELSQDAAERRSLMTFVVVGAGPTGVELAGQIVELTHKTLSQSFRNIDTKQCRVLLLDAAPVVLPPFGEKLSAAAAKELQRIGVEIKLNAMVTNLDATGLDLKHKDGSTERVDAICKVWAAGVQASPLGKTLADQSGVEVDRAGRVPVQPDLTLPGNPNVFVIGDMMSLDRLPGVAQVAIQGAKYAAKTIIADINGQPRPEKFKYFDKGSMAVISRFGAVAKINDRYRYRLTLTDGTVEMIDNPSSYPDPSNIVKQEEPFVDVHLYTPNDYVGALMDLCQQKRGVLIDMKYLDDVRVDLHYALPLGEIVYDFFDAIKSRSRGYASYDYEFKEYRESDLVKLDFLLNGDPVDALSMIVFRDNAYAKGRRICEKLRDNIPRTLFEIPVQAAIGGKIIARETVKAMRKDVLAKCYGGDISRKKKLLEKQKEGKKKMRQLGSVSLPSEAFTAVLKLDSTDD